ncbi:MAG: hypothetical protein WCJ81_06590 [bacterium]
MAKSKLPKDVQTKYDTVFGLLNEEHLKKLIEAGLHCPPERINDNVRVMFQEGATQHKVFIGRGLLENTVCSVASNWPDHPACFTITKELKILFDRSVWASPLFENGIDMHAMHAYLAQLVCKCKAVPAN